MNTRSLSSHARTNSSFSARNPYPGCTASHAVVSAAATTFEMQQVALRGGGRPDAHSLIGQLDVKRVAIGRRVDGHRLDPELMERADHAHGDLASVRDEHAFEHAQDPLENGRGGNGLELEQELAVLDRLRVLGVRSP